MEIPAPAWTGIAWAAFTVAVVVTVGIRGGDWLAASFAVTAAVVSWFYGCSQYLNARIVNLNEELLTQNEKLAAMLEDARKR
jgi:hypothetical protein